LFKIQFALCFVLFCFILNVCITLFIYVYIFIITLVFCVALHHVHCLILLKLTLAFLFFFNYPRYIFFRIINFAILPVKLYIHLLMLSFRVWFVLFKLIVNYLLTSLLMVFDRFTFYNLNWIIIKLNFRKWLWFLFDVVFIHLLYYLFSL
jgi:hypothetical protein